MKPRVLMCVTAYNGRSHIFRSLESAVRVDRSAADIDILVLDDCSPEPGFSEELAVSCRALGIGYYRSPRNLGIPRNVNLGLLSAVRGGYDHALVCNSDVIFPRNLVTGMLAAAAEPGVGSVTAWSNNVSVYSVPNENPDKYLAQQDVVDWVSASVAGNYAGSVMDIPAGISFCMLVPVAVIRDVGLMDPVFGRGYCEETDWTLRSLAAGYRITLAPGVFAYHAGGGSNREAGLLAEGHTSVPGHEAIIDLRYPQFRSQLVAFMSSGILQQAHKDCARLITVDGARQFGYTVDIGWLPRPPKEDTVARVIVAPDGRPGASIRFLGFEHELEADNDAIMGLMRQLTGRDPGAVNIFDRGATASRLQADDVESIQAAPAYPSRV